MSEKKLPPVEVRALRGKEAGTFERLLCQLLIQANSSEGLRKIIKMCQAMFQARAMVSDKDLGVDFGLVQRIYDVAIALDSTPKIKVVTWMNAYTHQALEWIWKYPVPWGFELNDETLETHINPWNTTTPNYYIDYVKNYHPQRINKSKVSCSGCGKVFLDLPSNDLEGEKWQKLIEEKFKEQIQETKVPLISEEQLKQESERYRRYKYNSYSYRDVEYRPPRLKIRSFKCPKCEKNITLDYKTEESNYQRGYDEEIYKTHKNKLDNEDPHLKVDEYSFHPPGAWSWWFYAVTQWLTENGYWELVNQFLSYATPLVTQWYPKLTGLVDPDLFQEMFRAMILEREEKPGESKPVRIEED